MKKIILLSVLLCFVFCISAQEEKEKYPIVYEGSVVWAKETRFVQDFSDVLVIDLKSSDKKLTDRLLEDVFEQFFVVLHLVLLF